MALTGVEPFDDLDRLSPEGLEGWWATRLAEVLAVAAVRCRYRWPVTFSQPWRMAALKRSQALSG